MRAVVSTLFASSLLSMFVAAPAQAAVAWSATFEKGDMSEWMAGINAVGPDKVRKNVEVSMEQAYRGKYAGKITVHPDDKFSADQVRVDIQHQSTLTDEGKEMWLSGHYFLPADVGGREEFGFFESNQSYQNVMDFWFDKKAGGGTTINFGTGFLGDEKLWTANFTTGVWHQVAIHVLWSTDPSKGTVDVWFDGQQVVTAAKAKTKADGNSLFFQTGLHRRDLYNVQTTDTVFLDDFIEADNFADAKIAAPSSEMGGTGGMAGAGGAAGAGGGSTGGVTAAGSSSGGSAPGGTGGAPNSAGMSSVGAGGTAGASSSAGTAGTAAGAPTAPVSDSSGCGLASKPRSSSVALLALLGAAAWLTGRRRSSAA